jgi:putative membrane protein
MSPRKLIYTASIAALALGLSQGAFAAGNTTSSTSAQSSAPQPKATEPATNLSHGDRKFLENAAQGGMAEVQLGKLAEQKASSDQVKQFGKRMVTDHQKANDELKKIASDKGFNLPAELSSSDRREYDKLQGKSGADFDREYMKEMVSDHKKDVKDFQSEAKSAKDGDLKNFATSTLPTLEQHLDLAQQTENAVKSGGSAQKTSSAR